MPFEYLAKSLDLDPELVTSTASATQDFAFRSEDRDSGSAVQRASLFTRSAILWCLVEPAFAPPLFAHAAAIHRERGRPRAAIFEVLASPFEPQSVPVPEGERTLEAMPDIQAIVLARAWPYALHRQPGDDLASLIERLDAQRARPMGRLRIPLRLYLDAARAVAAEGDELPRIMGEVLARAGDAGASLLRRSTSLSALQPGVLPLDPEVLALSLVTAVAYRARQKVRLSESNLGLTGFERVPLVVAELLAGFEPDERPPVATA